MSASATGSRLAVLVFTDIVGSTELKSRIGNTAYARMLGRHDDLFKELIAPVANSQIIADTGDGYFAAFATVSDAVRFALKFQQTMHEEKWSPHPLRTRIGIHVGEVAELADSAGGKPKIVGMAADLAARITSLGKGGQILLTRIAFDDARQFIGGHDPASDGRTIKWIAHGQYLFKGYDQPIEVFEVGVEGVAALSPPEGNDDVKRTVSAEQEEMLGWRPAMGLTVPGRVGWKLEHKLGEGTFGEVWLAVNEVTHQHRVFKFCFDAERLRSFKRELTLFRFLHDTVGERPDIAKLYDVRLDHPPYFLEGEHAPRGNLADWANGVGGLQNVPIDERLEVVAKVADAVAAAHSVGVLHKDIKPSNILMHVERDGGLQPRLSDFGIGILIDRDQLAAHQITEAGFTLLGGNESSRTGTRMYAPPESLASKPFTMQGDIYALGVLLYQMTVASLERPLATGWERDIEDELIRSDIAACVDGDPQRRLSSASDLAKRLRSFPQRKAEGEREKQLADAHARRRRMLRITGLASIACLLIAIASVAGYFRERTLREAIAGSEAATRDRERLAQARLLDNLSLTGDSLMQAKSYLDANTKFEEALTLSRDLAVPPLRAISGYLQSIGESPPPVMNRLATTRPDQQADPIMRVRVSPTGGFFIAGSSGERAYVIDATLGRIVSTLPTWGQALGICFTPDGKTCVVSGTRGLLQIWKVGQWDKPQATVDGTGVIYALAAAPDGKTFVSVEITGTPERKGRKLCFWSFEPLKLQRKVDAPDGLVSACFSPDGKFISTGGESGNILIWDTAAGTVAKTLSGHGDQIVGVVYTPDGKRLLSGSLDKTARLWDIATGQQIGHAITHRGPVRDVAVSHDGRVGATACSDETIKCWELAGGKQLLTFGGHSKGAESVEFLPDDSAIVSGGGNGRVAVWPLDTDCAPVFKVHGERVSSICVLPDGLTALSGGWDKTVKQFDLATGRVLRNAATPQQVWSLALAADGKSALVGQAHGVLQSLDLAGFTLAPINLTQFGQPMRVSDPSLPSTVSAEYSQTINAVAVSPQGSVAFAGGTDRKLSIFKLPPGSGGFSRRPATMPAAACFSPDGARVLVGGGQSLFILDTATGQVVQTLPKDPVGLRLVSSVAVSPDGQTAATGSFDMTVRTWDLASGTNTKTMFGHFGPVRAVAFLPDGNTIVSASKDNTVRLWDLTGKGDDFRALPGHGDEICALAVSPDGSIILSGATDGAVRKWDLALPPRYRKQLEAVQAGAYSKLDSAPDDAGALKTLGEWYALRRRDAQAVQCLERARENGAEISPLLLARCYWTLNRFADAQREFQAALAKDNEAAEYLNLCLRAVNNSIKK